MVSSVNSKKYLIIGGSGYIGSHMVALLCERGLMPVVFDRKALPKGLKKGFNVSFIKGDLRDYRCIKIALEKIKPDVVLMFAGLIVSPESNSRPIDYFDNNLVGAFNLLKAMDETGVDKLIFSSTAAVYGNPQKVPIQEDSKLEPINTYGYTKLMFEQIMERYSIANINFSFVALRYFNAAGAHDSGLIGENHEPETHLIPNVLRTIKGVNKELLIYGNDYLTRDGTCIRDYIHIQDLVEAHYKAINALERGIRNQFINLGNGRGFSNLEIIRMAEKVTGTKVKFRFQNRRSGDPAKLIASNNKAQKLLAWRPSKSLEDILKSAWEWEKKL